MVIVMVQWRKRSGVVIVWSCIALVSLMGAAALTIDVGQWYMAAQAAQDAADAGALSTEPYLDNPAQAEQTVFAVVGANNLSAGGQVATCESSDIVFYGPGSTLPDGTVLGPWARAAQVTCHVPTKSFFGRVIGITDGTVSRKAMVLEGPMGGGPSVPMWISSTTPYTVGQPQQLLMDDSAIPGNFGWLQTTAGLGKYAEWYGILSGEQSAQDNPNLWYSMGQTAYGYTGMSTGQWVAALKERLQAANSAFPGETWDNYSPDNPRILVVPMVTYTGGTGANAGYHIDQFGVFWLESITGPVTRRPSPAGSWGIATSPRAVARIRVT